jgi:hypothetical protein
MGGAVGEAIALSLLRSDFLFWTATKLAPGPMTRALLATDPALVAAAPPEEQRRVAALLAHILPVRLPRVFSRSARLQSGSLRLSL